MTDHPPSFAFAKPKSLRFWLCWLILAYVVPASLIAGFFLVDSYRRERATIGRDMVTTARVLMQAVDSELLGAQEALQVLATSPHLSHQDFAAFRGQAEALLPVLHGSNLVLLDKTGKPLLNTLKPYGEPLPRDASSERIKRVVESRQPSISDLFRGAISKQPLIAIDVPVIRDGQVAFVLAMGYFSNRLGEILRHQTVPTGWIMSVRDSAGVIVARSRDEDAYVGQKGSPEIEKALANADEGTFRMHDVGDVEKLGAFSRSPVTRWTISLGVPEQILIGTLQASLLINGAAALFLILVVMLLATIISRSLMRSVRVLTGPALALGAGETVAIPPIEISELNELGVALGQAAELVRRRGLERDAAERSGRELMIAKEAAEASDRAKSNFLALVSHELRTPMNGVIGIGSLLQNTDLTTDQRNMVDRLQESGTKLLGIINDILDLSEIEAGKLALAAVPLNLRGLIAGVTAAVGPEARLKGLELRTEIGTDVPNHVLGDPTRLRQILLHLVSNGTKFTVDGHVALRVSSQPDDTILFEITDTGIGIPSDRQSSLFQPFTQADTSTTRRFGGAGLGLAICKHLISAMPGGAIGFESVVDSGSRFWFTVRLPVSPEASVKGNPSGAFVTRILVAEDNLVNQMVIQSLLADAGHEVVIVGDGQAAVSAVQERNFDLILMDIQMPIMDGFEATRAIRRLYGAERSIPIIAVTANAMGFGIERFREAGIDDVLQKPIDADVLLNRIAAWGCPTPPAIKGQVGRTA